MLEDRVPKPARSFAGEQAAMAAFEASLPFEAVPLSHATSPRKRKMPTTRTM